MQKYKHFNIKKEMEKGRRLHGGFEGGNQCQ